MKTTLLRAISLLILPGLLHVTFSCKDHIAPEDYAWENVKIGGGGYVLGIVIHPLDPGLIYIRTDVGGAYRYDHQAGKMIPLFDWVPYEKKNLYGINGLALHPTDTSIIYAACGKRPAESPSDVYFSEDQGRTWEAMGLNKPFSGNAHPNRQGHMLRVNPHHPEEVWSGTTGEGLWKYDGETWSQVPDIPPENVVRSICFDPGDSYLVYVAVSHAEFRGISYGMPEFDGIYRSVDAGRSFSRIEGIPEGYDQFTEISLSKNGDKLFVSTLDSHGSKGGIFRLDRPATGMKWEDITPVEGGFRTVNTSPHHNEVVMTARGSYASLSYFFVSRDGGDSWIRKDQYEVHNIIPWHPDTYPGSAISRIAFDPVDPERIYFTDWYSVYRTNDWTADTILWSNEIANGHEEIVPSRILSAHPKNQAEALLYVGGADISGLTIRDLHQFSSVPNWRRLAESDLLQEVSGIDLCEDNPDVVVACGGRGWDMETGGAAVSRDGGLSFSLVPGFDSIWGGGRVAVSATDEENIVALSKGGGIVYTTDGGITFHHSEGPRGSYGIDRIFSLCHPLCSDRVNGNYYLYDQGTGEFMVSTDQGASFQRVSVLDATESEYINLIAVPDQAGHLWLTLGEEGLRHTDDGGTSWTAVSDFSIANLVAAGKPAPGTDQPTIFVWGRKTTDDMMCFYRAESGQTDFHRINEESRAGFPRCMAGDRKVFGRFYVATNGRGVYYAEISEESP